METNCSTSSKPKTVKEFFSSWYFWKPFIGVITGGLAGFLYFYFIGCNSGACAITSNPYRSILFGAILGYLIAGSPCVKSSKATPKTDIE